MRFHSIQFDFARALNSDTHVKCLISFELNGNQTNFAFIWRFTSRAYSLLAASLIIFVSDPRAQTVLLPILLNLSYAAFAFDFNRPKSKWEIKRGMCARDMSTWRAFIIYC